MPENEKPTLTERLLGVIYPPRCVLCHRLLPAGSFWGLCELCRFEDYLHPQPQMEGGRCSFIYEGDMQQVIYRLKYKELKQYARYMARWMAAEGGKWAAAQHFTRLCAVPLAKEKMKSRGFNQAQLIAQELARLLQIPYSPLLERVYSTKAQSGLSKLRRRQNLQGAFAAAPLKEKGTGAGHTICIVDDIYTTGATVEACRSALLERYPQARVIFWVFSMRRLPGTQTQSLSKF